ncbi:MAG: hypothetical protein H7831_05865 [Magnetococcus sp. WYHC-3]
MSSRSTLVAMIGLLGAIFMPVAQADDGTTNDTIRIAGQITKIDGHALIIVSTTGQETVLRYTEATKISREGKTSAEPLRYTDIKVGQLVQAYYSNNDKAIFGIIIADALATKPPAP